MQLQWLICHAVAVRGRPIVLYKQLNLVVPNSTKISQPEQTGEQTAGVFR